MRGEGDEIVGSDACLSDFSQSSSWLESGTDGTSSAGGGGM